MKFLHLRRRTKSAAAGERSANILLIPGTSSVAHLCQNVARAALTVSEANVSSTAPAHKEAHKEDSATRRPAHRPERARHPH